MKIIKCILVAPNGICTKRLRRGIDSRVTPKSLGSIPSQGVFVQSNKSKHILRVEDLHHIIDMKALDVIPDKNQPLYVSFDPQAINQNAGFLKTVLKARDGNKIAIQHLKELDYLRPTSNINVKDEEPENCQFLMPYYLSELIARRTPRLKLLAQDLREQGLVVTAASHLLNFCDPLIVSRFLQNRDDLLFAIGFDLDLIDRYDKWLVPDADIKMIKLFPIEQEKFLLYNLHWQTAHASFVFYPNDVKLPFSPEVLREEPEMILALPGMKKMEAYK